MFSIEKLKVYDRALTSVAALAKLAAPWDKRHVVVDHLLRASESVVLNIAEGARLRGTANRQHVLDYAIGSDLECAACLDIVVLKQFLSPELAFGQKQPLCEVVKMLVGLRKAWAGGELHENSGTYGGQERWLFAHERLAAYQVSLEFVGWFHALPGARELSSRLYRQIDKASTSVVLNIAEGNGGCLGADRHQFVEIAESSAVKVATFLDLCERTAEVDSGQRQSGIALLNRIGLLWRGLSALS